MYTVRYRYAQFVANGDTKSWGRVRGANSGDTLSELGTVGDLRTRAASNRDR